MHIDTRTELEKNRTDANRFMQAKDYTSADSLKYFRTEANRRLFQDWFHSNQVLSNETFRAIAEVSSPEVNYVPAVTKPATQVWILHRQKCINEFKSQYTVNLPKFCQLYHDSMKIIVQNNFKNPSQSLETLFFELLKSKFRFG